MGTAITQQVDGVAMILSNRRISTYLNALAEAGFFIEKMVKQTDRQTLDRMADSDDRSRKAQKLPLSFVFKAWKIELSHQSNGGVIYVATD